MGGRLAGLRQLKYLLLSIIPRLVSRGNWADLKTKSILRGERKIPSEKHTGRRRNPICFARRWGGRPGQAPPLHFPAAGILGLGTGEPPGSVLCGSNAWEPSTPQAAGHDLPHPSPSQTRRAPSSLSQRIRTHFQWSGKTHGDPLYLPPLER